MKRAQRNTRTKKNARTTLKEPLAEGIKKERRPYGFFAKMSDVELVRYTEGVMKEKGIKGRKELETADEGLYDALRRRKLRDKIGFEEKQRPWGKMSHGKVVDFAKRFMKEKGISGRRELEKADLGLYEALRRRKLLDKVGFEDKYKDWTPMSNEELVALAKRFMKEKGISGKAELQSADRRLYLALWRRKLLDKVGFEEKRHSWKELSDDTLVAFAKRLMKEKEIRGKEELRKADKGLYEALRRRKLLDSVGFEEKQRKRRPWASMSDDEIVSYAKRVIKEKKISGRKGLEKTDGGLYRVLRKRKLFETVGFEKKQRPRKRRAEKPVKASGLEKNENKANAEIESIALRRKELILEGKNDKEIARQIAEEMGKRPESIMILILRILKNGLGSENSNSKNSGDSG